MGATGFKASGKLYSPAQMVGKSLHRILHWAPGIEAYTLDT